MAETRLNIHHRTKSGQGTRQCGLPTEYMDEEQMQDLILFAFITGNSNSETLLEGLSSKIHMHLSSWFSAGIEMRTRG